MARARAIDIRLERMVPAMEEYFIKGIFTKDELRDIAKQRTNHEYKLVARPLLYVDVRKAIDFELELEARIAKFLSSAEVQIKNRGAIVDHIVHIYDIAIPCICKGGVSTTKQQNLERDTLELQYLTFLKEFNRDAELSKYLASELQRAPNNVNAWVFSVEWELSKGNIDNARSIAQESLKQCSSSSPKVWTSLMTVETTFAAHLARGILETDRTATKEKKKSKKAKNNSNEDAAAKSDNEDEDQEDETRKLPLSQRYQTVNQALATIVVDGALVRGACSAALQSSIGGIDLLDDVRSTLLLENQQNQGEMSGYFIAKYLFAECAKKQFELFQQQHQEVQNKENKEKSKNIKNINDRPIAVATRASSGNLNLVANALVCLIRAPFDYFFSNQQRRQSAPRFAASHHFWSTATFLDEAPPVCPTKLAANHRKSEDDAAAAAAAKKSSASACVDGLALQTLGKLVLFSRATAHPVAVKAALQFAEEVMLEKKILTKQQVTALFSTIAGKNAAVLASAPATSCCASCQSSFNTCAVEEFDPLLETMKKEMLAQSRQQQEKHNNNNANTDLLLISKWISGEFKNILEKEQNINLIVSLAPTVVLGNNNNDDNNNQDDSAASSSSSSSLSALDTRLRAYLASVSSSNGKKTANDTNNLEKLSQELNAWFDQQQFGAPSSATNLQRAQALFGSEAISNQVTTMLLGRAIALMMATKASNSNDKKGSSSKQQSLPLRRNRIENDDDDSDEDEIGNKKKSSSNNGVEISGFLDIIKLFKLTQPTTPKQIEVRAGAVALVASVWLEMLFLLDHQSDSQIHHELTFPFVTNLSIASPSSLFVEGIKKMANININNNNNNISSIRAAISACASVLPPSIAFLVEIAASIEFNFAVYSKNGDNKTQCITKMRQYFESAVSQSPKCRSTWQTWKQFETKLGNLKQAGDVQRRASQALNDSRMI